MRCPNCKNEVPEGKRFCGYCGNQLVKKDPFDDGLSTRIDESKRLQVEDFDDEAVTRVDQSPISINNEIEESAVVENIQTDSLETDSELVICAKCGKSNFPDATYCSYCKASLADRPPFVTPEPILKEKSSVQKKTGKAKIITKAKTVIVKPLPMILAIVLFGVTWFLGWLIPVIILSKTGLLSISYRAYEVLLQYPMNLTLLIGFIGGGIFGFSLKWIFRTTTIKDGLVIASYSFISWLIGWWVASMINEPLVEIFREMIINSIQPYLQGRLSLFSNYLMLWGNFIMVSGFINTGVVVFGLTTRNKRLFPSSREWLSIASSTVGWLISTACGGFLGFRVATFIWDWGLFSQYSDYYGLILPLVLFCPLISVLISSLISGVLLRLFRTSTPRRK